MNRDILEVYYLCVLLAFISSCSLLGGGSEGTSEGTKVSYSATIRGPSQGTGIMIVFYTGKKGDTKNSQIESPGRFDKTIRVDKNEVGQVCLQASETAGYGIATASISVSIDVNGEEEGDDFGSGDAETCVSLGGVREV